jgi:adenylate kinase family enzyme
LFQVNSWNHANISKGHITIGLLRKEMYKYSSDTFFLIDGFPRDIEQGLDFEKQVSPCKFVLFFECPQEIMIQRLLQRSLTSGRTDDNIESIQKRFTTHENQVIPVINYYSSLGKVITIDSSRDMQEIFLDVKKIFGLHLN